MAEGAETERCHPRFHSPSSYYCFRQSHTGMISLAPPPPDMRGGDRGIGLLGFASPVCRNAFPEILGSGAVSFCFIKIHLKTMEETFQWITTTEITSRVLSAPSFTDYPLVAKRVLPVEKDSPD